MMPRSLLVGQLVLSASGVARADVALDLLDRRTGVSFTPFGGPSQQQLQLYRLAGPYNADFVIDEGDVHVRSVHDSSVVVDGATLTIGGTYVADVSDAAESLVGTAEASALTIVAFTVSELRKPRRVGGT